MAKIILAGGSGFIGQKLTELYSQKENEVYIFTRGKERQNKNIYHINWDGTATEKHTHIFENSDLVINLTGKSINCRHNEKNLKEILDSRVNSTISIGNVISQCKNPPKMWMNSSAIAIYENTFDEKLDESSSKISNDYLAEICVKWENAFNKFELPNTKKVILRTGIVLGLADGAFPVLSTLTKLGLGGTQGSGKQYMSWIHEDDVVSAIDYIYINGLTGIFNITAPNPVTNADFMRSMRKSFGIPIGIPAPSFGIKIGSTIVGTESKLVLDSLHIIPKRLLDVGFKFGFKNANEAIADISK